MSRGAVASEATELMSKVRNKQKSGTLSSGTAGAGAGMHGSGLGKSTLKTGHTVTPTASVRNKSAAK